MVAGGQRLTSPGTNRNRLHPGQTVTDFTRTKSKTPPIPLFSPAASPVLRSPSIRRCDKASLTGYLEPHGMRCCFCFRYLRADAPPGLVVCCCCCCCQNTRSLPTCLRYILHHRYFVLTLAQGKMVKPG